MVLVLVGLTVMPAIQPSNLAFELYYGHYNTIPITLAAGSYEAAVIAAAIELGALAAGPAGWAALAIMASPTIIE